MARHFLRVEIDHEDIQRAMDTLKLSRGEAIALCSLAVHNIPPRGARNVRTYDSPLENSAVYLRWTGPAAPGIPGTSSGTRTADPRKEGGT